MSHDVYGSNLPTFDEFFGPIAIPVVVMLSVLAGLGWGTLRKSRTVRVYDASLWFMAGLGITIFFAMHSREKLGVDEYFFGSLGVAWLIVLTGIGINLSRLRRQRGFWTITEALTPVGCVFLLIALFFPAMGNAREAALRTQCKNNLKQIGLALHNYNGWNHSFPSQAAGQPPQSWRLHLMPFIESNSIFEQYHQDLPWDSPENAEFARRTILAYQCPSQKHIRDDQDRFLTSYALMYGPQGIWRDDRRPLPIGKIKDGTSNTIAVMEACGQNIVWNEPRDLDGTITPAAINLPGESRQQSPAMASSLHRGGAHVILADGSVRFISQNTDPQTLQTLVTADGGETVGDW